MKKYWKLLVLFIFTIVMLSFFYVQVSSYSDTFPEFSFQKIDGDEEVVDPLLINGEINFSMLDFESFKVGTSGTEYLRDKSFFERLEGYYLSEDMIKLREENRGFMRGKEGHPDYFFEDDQVVAYATTAMDFFSVHNSEFTIDVLNKQTDKQTTFSVPIPDNEQYWYIEVVELKVVDNMLYIITRNETEDYEAEENIYSIHHYAVDLSNEKLQSAEDVHNFASSFNMNGYSDVQMLFNDDPKDMKYVVVDYAAHYKDGDDEFMEETEETSIESIQFYDIQTNEQTVIKPPKDTGMPIAYKDNIVYLGDFGKSDFKLTSYDTKGDKVIHQTKLELESGYLTYGDMDFQSLVQNGKLYFTTVTDDGITPPMITVLDLDTLKTDYVGKIEMKEGSRENILQVNGFHTYDTYFNEPELKRN